MGKSGAGNIMKTLRTVLICLLAGCGSTQRGDVSFDSLNALPRLGSDNAASAPGEGKADTDAASAGEEQPEYYDRTGTLITPPLPIARIDSTGDDGVSFTFKNTDIRVVLRAVLSDTLGVAYFVDPRVQGTVSLETSGPVSTDVLLDVLETTLRTKSVAMVATERGYDILPAQDAPQSRQSLRPLVPANAGAPGYGVHVVPLRFVSATEMQEILQPFAPSGGILRTDARRNLLVIGGTSREIAAMLQAVQTFDVDWMRGMSFALFPIKYVDAEKLVEELALIRAAEGAAADIPRLVPLPRISKVLAVAPDRQALEQVEFWIRKLDMGGSSPGRRIYVYNVQNGRSEDVARSINALLGIGGIGGQFGGGGFGAVGGQGAAFGQGAVGQGAFAQGQGFGNRAGPGGGLGGAGFGTDFFRIVPAGENNSLLIWASPSEFAVVENALQQLDIPPRQVMIEATIAEVTLTDELRYGLQWRFDIGDNVISFGQSDTPAAEFPGFSWGYTNSSDATVILNAIESLTDVSVISAPKVLVLNNESATLQVGEEVPVPTASAISTEDANARIVNQIQFRNTGIILTVTPRINEGGLVMLDVSQEVSEVIETASSGIDAPTIQQRRINSSVAVQSGDTVALGGLIRTTGNRVKSGVPILKDIPLLGAAFRETDIIERRSELIILLTPRLMADPRQSQQVMDYLRDQFRSIFPAAAADDSEPETVGTGGDKTATGKADTLKTGTPETGTLKRGAPERGGPASVPTPVKDADNPPS